MKLLRSWTVAVLAGGVAAWVTGCGSSKDPVDLPPAKYPDVASYCTELARAECSAAVTEACQVEQSACVTARTGACGQQMVAGATVREAQADACIAATAAAHQDDKVTPDEVKTMNEECEDVLSGSGGEGVTCDANVDCDLEAGLECVIPTGQTSGNCRIPDIKAPGTACDSVDAVCEDGYYCTASDQVCAARQSEAKACDATKLCAEGLRCVPAAPPEVAGTCEPKLGFGVACNTADECDSGICDMVGSSRQCMSVLRFAPSEPICATYRTP